MSQLERNQFCSWVCKAGCQGKFFMFPPRKWKHTLVWKWRYQKVCQESSPNKLAWNLVLKVKISNHESENIQTSLSQVTSCFFQDYQTLNIHKKSCESWDWSNEASAVEGQGPEVVCWFIWASWKKGPVWLCGVDMELQGLSIPNLDAWVGWLVGIYRGWNTNQFHKQWNKDPVFNQPGFNQK